MSVIQRMGVLVIAMSYSYDYGAADENCRMFYQWIAGVVTLGRTGGFLFGWDEEDGV